MRGVAGPASLMIDHFPVYHIGIGSIVVVENGADRPLHLAIQKPFTKNIIGTVLRLIENAAKLPVISGALD